MNGWSADLEGERAWELAIERKFTQVERSTPRAMKQGLRVVERSYKKILRTYTHPEGTPTTSPPGEPPALVTGTLMRSVKTRGPFPGKRRYQYVGRVGPTAVYARIQDLGGDVRKARRPGARRRPAGLIHIPARPYAQRATDRVRRDVRRLFQVRWTAALQA